MKAANTNIFESNSQLIWMDPRHIRPLFDRLLIKDVADEDKIGSIWIPETAAERGVGKQGLLRMGIVVAVGPGDPWACEKLINGGTSVFRKALGSCPSCGGGKRYRIVAENGAASEWKDCPECKGDGIRRWPMYCKPGDTIIFDRRKEAEIFIDGQRYGLIHEEQSVFAVLE